MVERKQCLWWTIASSLSLQAKAPPRIKPPNPETRNPNRSQDNISTHVHFNIHLSQPPRQGATPHLAPEPQNPKPETRNSSISQGREEGTSPEATILLWTARQQLHI